MCIIAIKDRGVEFPTWDTINRMWHSNPDGAGFMFPTKNGVQICKGFMTLDDFKKGTDAVGRVINLKNTPLIMHFRIGTHGVKRNPANTHPFPVSSDREILKKLNCVTDVGFAHNGMISGVDTDPDISDTMMYSVQVLSELMSTNKNFFTDKHLMNVIENTIDGSRMVFMDKSGGIYKVGTWIEDKETGMVYSNSGYKPYDLYDDLWYYKGFSHLGAKHKNSDYDMKDKAGNCYKQLHSMDCLYFTDGSECFVSEYGKDLYADENGVIYELKDNYFYCEEDIQIATDICGEPIAAYADIYKEEKYEYDI